MKDHMSIIMKCLSAPKLGDSGGGGGGSDGTI